MLSHSMPQAGTRVQARCHILRDDTAGTVLYARRDGSIVVRPDDLKNAFFVVYDWKILPKPRRKRA